MCKITKTVAYPGVSDKKGPGKRQLACINNIIEESLMKEVFVKRGQG